MTFDFGGEAVIASGSTLECPAKKTIVLFSKIQEFMLDRSQKMVVGIRGDTNEPCRMWQDSHFVHIGCLKETITQFDRKFIEVTKLLNR